MTKRPKRAASSSKACCDGEEPKLPKYRKVSAGTNCGICGKFFQHDHKLRVHLRIHTGETPFSCGYCEKSFAQKAALTVHERTHTGERPFACSMCDKSFARADHLNQHNRTHTGEKPYSCSECGKSFATWSAVSRHKGEHAVKEAFPCSMCNKSFSRTDNLRTHMVKAHDSDPSAIPKQAHAPRKRRAQAKTKDAPKQLDVGSTSEHDDMQAIAKILEEDEEEEQAAASDLIEKKIKDEPIEDDDVQAEVSGAVIIHDNMEEPKEELDAKSQDNEEDNPENDDMIGSHFLFA